MRPAKVRPCPTGYICQVAYPHGSGWPHVPPQVRVVTEVGSRSRDAASGLLRQSARLRRRLAASQRESSAERGRRLREITAIHRPPGRCAGESRKLARDRDAHVLLPPPPAYPTVCLCTRVSKEFVLWASLSATGAIPVHGTEGPAWPGLSASDSGSPALAGRCGGCFAPASDGGPGTPAIVDVIRFFDSGHARYHSAAARPSSAEPVGEVLSDCF